MNIFLKIAWRNILRSRYRSLITVLAVAIGFASLIFIRSFVDGADYQMIENYTDLIAGHIEIHHLGFQSNMGLDKSISSPDEIISILKDNPDITAFSLRVKEFVLASSAEHSSGVLLMGIDPAAETKVTEMNKRIRKGSFLSDDDEIIIGKDLASSLNVALGDKVVLIGQAFDGSLANAAYRVAGIVDTGAEEIDRSLVVITLRAAQEFFVLGNRVSEITVRVTDLNEAGTVREKLKLLLNNMSLEVLTWREIAPMLAQWIEFDIAFINIILLVVLLVVAAGILNTLLMATLERVKEFGIMLALGTKRAQIVLMIAFESLILGAVGMVLGYIAGIGISVYFKFNGIDLAAFSKALDEYYIGSIIYPRLSSGYLVAYGAVILMTCMVVSIYPAWRAANLKPVEAIRS
jgi:ABC-type lipoprotein release transport system permease subunit